MPELSEDNDLLTLGTNKEDDNKRTNWTWKTPWIEIRLSLITKRRNTTWRIVHGRRQRSLGVKC